MYTSSILVSVLQIAGVVGVVFVVVAVVVVVVAAAAAAAVVVVVVAAVVVAAVVVVVVVNHRQTPTPNRSLRSIDGGRHPLRRARAHAFRRRGGARRVVGGQCRCAGLPPPHH
jgi:hypothetical protein